MISISVIIITADRLEYLAHCLDSIRNAKLNSQELSIYIIYNGMDQDKIDLDLYKDLNIFETKLTKTTPAQARNSALEKVNGDYICFLDDDVYLPIDYFKNVNSILSKNIEIDVLGGPDQTPPNSSRLQQSIGAALENPFVTGPTYKRHNKTNNSNLQKCSEKELILCHLWFKRSLFSKEKFKFDTDYFRNEENVLLNHLVKANKEIYYDSRIYVFHHRKKKLNVLIKAISRSGYFRAVSIVYKKSQCSIIFFIPSLVILLFLLSLALVSPDFLIKAITFLSIIYFLFLLLSIEAARKSLAFSIFALSGLIHLSYGIGFIGGLITTIYKFVESWAHINILKNKKLSKN